MDSPHHDLEDCPVSALLDLVQQDDVEHLRNSLLDSIENLQQGCEIFLYEHTAEVFEKDSNSFPGLVSHRGKSIDLEEHKNNIRLTCNSNSIQLDGFNYLDDDKYVQVFTVEGEKASRGLLITITRDVLNESYINSLVTAYNHQIHLLRNRDTDALTGLLNRQHFDKKLLKVHQSLGHHNRKDDEPVDYCFALFDIDFFKRVNDKYGHVYGDEVLLIFADLMKRSFRDIDLLFRYGGEEFAVLLHDANIEQGRVALERFRKAVEEFNFPLQNKVTTSIGCCEFTNEVALPSIIENADKALYFSKQNGRNQLNSYKDLVSQQHIQESVIDDGDIELF